jgi:hypothetical protein
MRVDPFGSDAGFYDPRAMLEQRIQQQFYESADLKVRTADELAKPIADAAIAVLGAVSARASPTRRRSSPHSSAATSANARRWPRLRSAPTPA